MATLSFVIASIGVMIPYGIVIFVIDWVYSKVINAFTGRGGL